MSDNVDKIDLGYFSVSAIAETDWFSQIDGSENSGEVNLDGNEIVTSLKELNLEIDYPLSIKAVKNIKAKNDTGFTRAELAKTICDFYAEIYKEEEQTSTILVQNIPGMLNRDRTNGKYGIWGHDIEDLILHSAYIDKNIIPPIVKVGCDS